MIRKLKGPKGKRKARVELRPPIERLQHFWTRGQFYERPVLDYIYKHYRHQGGWFVDAGSSIGNHALWFALYCNATAVASIEPVKSSLSWQRHNLELNWLGNVHCYNVALSDKEGRGKMAKAPANPRARWPWNLGMWNLEEGEGPTRIVTLDGLLEKNGIAGVTLVKMDIEGCEMKALQGATRLLRSDHPVLFLETYPESRHQEFADFLGKFGYKGQKIYKNMCEFKHVA